MSGAVAPPAPTGRHDRYPSRLDDRPAITRRLDPVVWGDGTGPLDGDLVTSYAEDGFLVLDGLLSPADVAELNEAIDAQAADPATRARPEAIVEPGGAALRSLFAIHALEGPLGAVASDPRLLAAARQLLGGEVYMHQSRANLKPAFRGKEFYWHSDFETWHTEDGMPAMRALSCSILLTDNMPWNGPLLTIAGSHRWFVSCVGETPEGHFAQSLRKQEVGTPDEGSLRELCARGRLGHCLGQAGTVVLFDCNLMHGSNGNITPHPRRNLFLVYNSVANALEAPYAAPEPRPDFVASRRPRPL